LLKSANNAEGPLKMTDLPLEQLLPKAKNSIYRLVSLAATRALELSEGRRCLADNINTEKFTTMALQEIIQGKIEVKDAQAVAATAGETATEIKEEEKAAV
jgi:DNA-directed RNA polymerase omega subunit